MTAGTSEINLTQAPFALPLTAPGTHSEDGVYSRLQSRHVRVLCVAATRFVDFCFATIRQRYSTGGLIRPKLRLQRVITCHHRCLGHGLGEVGTAPRPRHQSTGDHSWVRAEGSWDTLLRGGSPPVLSN